MPHLPDTFFGVLIFLSYLTQAELALLSSLVLVLCNLILLVIPYGFLRSIGCVMPIRTPQHIAT